MEGENYIRKRKSTPKLPPKSRFNDAESTAVLRLFVKQKLLNTKDDNPALRKTPEKPLRHLPPVKPDASLEERWRQKEIKGTQESHCIHLKEDRPAIAGGIYQSPKLARPTERPKGSYGRRKQESQTKHELHQLTGLISRPPSRLHLQKTISYEETISNLKEQTLKLGSKLPAVRTRSCRTSCTIPEISQDKPSLTWDNSLSNSLNSKINCKSEHFQS